MLVYQRVKPCSWYSLEDYIHIKQPIKAFSGATTALLDPPGRGTIQDHLIVTVQNSTFQSRLNNGWIGMGYDMVNIWKYDI